MSDIDLRQFIVDELEFEPSIDAANIGVAVHDGVVTLTGHVPTFMEKTTAERTVGRIKGVKGIACEIEVRPIGANITADDEIARRAVHQIEWNVQVPKNSVQVRVEKGWVTLSGKLHWHFQRAAVENAVHALSGVRGVINNIAVAPRATAPDVKKRIEDALKRDAEIDAHAIKVDVRDGKVVLEGKVRAWAERQAAERAAWAAPGVKAVEDHISIVSVH